MKRLSMILVSVIFILLNSSFDTTFCTGRSDRYYQDPADCTAFYLCIGEEVKQYGHCPTGLAFDDKSMICNWMENVLCITSRAHGIENPCECPNGKGQGKYFFCSILVGSSVDCVKDSPCVNGKAPNSVCNY